EAPGGGVREKADVGETGFIEPHQPGRDLGHLHQAHRAFLHAGTAGCGDDQQRLMLRDRTLDGARDHFADYRTHAAADESRFHGADLHRAPVQPAFGRDHGIAQIGGLLHHGETLAVWLAVYEAERVAGAESGIAARVLALIHQEFEAGDGVDATVRAALGANVPVGLQVLLPDDLAAALAL